MAPRKQNKAQASPPAQKPSSKPMPTATQMFGPAGLLWDCFGAPFDRFALAYLDSSVKAANDFSPEKLFMPPRKGEGA